MEEQNVEYGKNNMFFKGEEPNQAQYSALNETRKVNKTKKEKSFFNYPNASHWCKMFKCTKCGEAVTYLNQALGQTTILEELKKHGHPLSRKFIDPKTGKQSNIQRSVGHLNKELQAHYRLNHKNKKGK